MSFDLLVWRPTIELSDSDALEQYQRAMSEGFGGLLETAAELDELYARLTATFPDVDAVDVDDPDELALEYERSPAYLHVAMGWGEIGLVAPIIVRDALALGLSIFDPQFVRQITTETGDPGDWVIVQEREPSLDDAALADFEAQLEAIDPDRHDEP